MSFEDDEFFPEYLGGEPSEPMGLMDSSMPNFIGGSMFTDNNKAKNGRVLPHSIEAERAVLGCVMIDENAPLHILGELEQGDFYSKSHKKIFDAMKAIALKDKPIDIITLVTELETSGDMDSIGGLSYLNELSNIVPSASNYMHYSAIVKKSSTLRKLISVSGEISTKAFSGDADDDALKFAEGKIYSLAEKLDKSSLEHAQKSLTEAIEKMELMFRDPNAGKGIPTGFKQLDKLLNGFQNSDLILIAARPGQGKTSIGMNFIAQALMDGNRRTLANKPDPYKCAVFSLEMPAVQLSKRMICALAKVDMGKASSGDLNNDEWKRIYNAKEKLDKSNLYIDDSSLTTPIEILSKCRRLKREKGLDLVMIDYLQLMSAGKKTDSRQHEVSEITRTLKIAAKELNVPILLLSQMSRDIEKRTDKTPQMSDLRESGAIEQDADIIMFIYRKHASNDTSVDANTRDKVQLIVAKHRNGSTGNIDMRWCGDYVSFEDVVYSPNLEASVPPTKTDGSFSVATEDFGNASSLEGNSPPLASDVRAGDIPPDSARATFSGVDESETTQNSTVEEIEAVQMETKNIDDIM